jgi:hypothetical protein
MIFTNNHKEREIILSENDSEFLNLISNRITMYKQIPYDVPQQLIIDIVRESALMFFRYGYSRAQETKLFYLPLSELTKYGNVSEVSDMSDHNPYAQGGFYAGSGTLWSNSYSYNKGSGNHGQYKDPKTGFLGYTVKLPGYVNVVSDIHETNNNRTFSALNLIQNMQYMGQVSPYGQSLVGINSSLYLIEAVCKLVEGQAMESILNKGIPFNYNNSTHTLNFMSVIEHNLILQTICNVNIEHLYGDDLYIRYVVARTKMELRRKIGSHTIQLPGDVILNVDELCNNTEDAEKVEELLKMGSAVGDIILYR